MNNDQLTKTQTTPIETNTYTVTLDSAEICGDPQITFTFTLSRSTTQSVEVIKVWNATKGRFVDYPQTRATLISGSKYSTPLTSIPEGQVYANNQVQIKVQVQPILPIPKM